MLSVVEGADAYQAGLTFAMARHVVVDLAQVYQVPPIEPDPDRLPEDRLRRLREELGAAGLDLREGEEADRALAELRGMYEPFLAALSRHFLLDLPPLLPEAATVDNWQTSAWMRRTAGSAAWRWPTPTTITPTEHPPDRFPPEERGGIDGHGRPPRELCKCRPNSLFWKVSFNLLER